MNRKSNSHCRIFGVAATKAKGCPWNVIWVTLAAEGVGIIAFYAFGWSWLRQILVAWLDGILAMRGYAVQAGVHSLTVGDHHFQIDSDCTYVDLVLCSLPLLWRVRRSVIANLGVLCGFAIAVMAVNLLRVLFGIHALTVGANMFWAHDLLDYILWYPTLTLVALFWVRSLHWRDNERELPLIAVPEEECFQTLPATSMEGEQPST